MRWTARHTHPLEQEPMNPRNVRPSNDDSAWPHASRPTRTSKRTNPNATRQGGTVPKNHQYSDGNALTAANPQRQPESIFGSTGFCLTVTPLPVNETSLMQTANAQPSQMQDEQPSLFGNDNGNIGTFDCDVAYSPESDAFVYMTLVASEQAARTCRTQFEVLLRKHPQAVARIAGVAANSRNRHLTVEMNLGPMALLSKRSTQALAGFKFAADLHDAMFEYSPLYVGSPSAEERDAADYLETGTQVATVTPTSSAYSPLRITL